MRAQTVLAACALILVPTLCFADDDPTVPPAGISPAPAMSLARLMKLHREAAGKLDQGTAHTRVEVWKYSDGGLSGTQTVVYSGNDFREDVTLGPFQSSRGELGGKRWEQNENGLTRTISGVHQKDDVNDYALTHPLLRDSGVQLLGQVTSPVHAYVVRVAPGNGRVEYAYYDWSTYALVRDERAQEGRRIVRTYDDFRVTKGIREPWHIHENNGLPKDDRDWQMQSLTIGGTVDASKLAIPPSRDPVTLSGPRVTLPAKINGDRVTLTMQIGAHKINLLMDSGSSGILLNRDVADATGVKSYGELTEVTAGEYESSDALIPKIDLGVATMQNVSAETAPYAEMSYGDTPVAGLMGYDFIAGSVIHIDYENGVVEAIAPGSFTAPAGAIALQIRLDDGVPIIDATIGTTVGHDFIVDTGADRSMIFSGFAKAHPSDVTDQGLGDEMTASLPFISKISGVGGKVQIRPLQVSALTIGSIRLPDWLFYVSQDAPSFESDDYDGLIGQDVLRNFDVYFDYSRTMMYLVPNKRYRERWGG